MKKLFIILLAVIFIVPTTLILTACGDGQKEPLPKDPNVSVKVYNDFVFDGNKLIGYTGKDTEIIVPSSYSVRNTGSDVRTAEYKITDIINYGDESSLDYEIWSSDISDYERLIFVGGMYYVSVNGGEKQYVKVGEAKEFFTTVKKSYNDKDTTIALEFGDYVLTAEDQVDESNFSIITRPFIEMIAGKLESFTMEYNDNKVEFTKENYLQNMNIFSEILGSGGVPESGIRYDIGNYLEFIEGEDHVVDTIASLSPDKEFGGGLFETPEIGAITIPSSVKTISEGTFEKITTLKTVTIESAEIYKALTDNNACGELIANATTVKVLKNIVDGQANANEFLNSDQNYSRTETEEHYVYTKKTI